MMNDPRGPIRQVLDVDEWVESTEGTVNLLHLTCGHVAKSTAYMKTRPGEQARCLQCKNDEGSDK